MSLKALRQTVPAALVLLFAGLALAACSQPRPTPPSNEPQKLLFLGNSFTYYNGGVGQHVQQLAATARVPKRVVVDSETKGGATLKILYGRQSVHDKVRANYDIVVLQEDIPEYREHVIQPFLEYAERFDQEIRNSGGKTALFMAWPYKRLNWVTLQEIIQAHRDIGDRLHIPVAPVGLAFERALAKRPTMAMLGPDNEHETIHGTYLAANVIYATVFRESPVACTYKPDGISPEEAQFLRRIAWETVRAWQKR